MLMWLIIPDDDDDIELSVFKISFRHIPREHNVQNFLLQQLSTWLPFRSRNP